MPQLPHIWLVATSSSWLLLSLFDILSILWLTSLFSSTRCSRLSLPFPCSIPRVSHFGKEPGFLLMQSGVYKMRFGPQECPLLLGSVTASFSVQSYGIHTRLQLYFSSMHILKAIRSHLCLLFQSGITHRVYFNCTPLRYFQNSFIEMWCIYHTIHLLKVYSSVAVSVVTELCDHHHSQF